MGSETEAEGDSESEREVEDETPPPDPPEGLPKRLVNVLEPRSSGNLREIAEWVDALVEWQETMPEPPAAVPEHTLDRVGVDEKKVGGQSIDRLELLGGYARELADWKLSHDLTTERAKERNRVSDEEREALAERDDVDLDSHDVPKKAYIVKKEIDGEKYYYYQWREGADEWGYEYIRPADMDEE
jgi:hypothetical protein